MSGDGGLHCVCWWVQVGLPPGMKPVENEEGNALEPGADKSRDGKDRRDRMPGEDVSTQRCWMGPGLSLHPHQGAYGLQRFWKGGGGGRDDLTFSRP